VRRGRKVKPEKAAVSSTRGEKKRKGNFLISRYPLEGGKNRATKKRT